MITCRDEKVVGCSRQSWSYVTRAVSDDRTRSCGSTSWICICVDSCWLVITKNGDNSGVVN